MMLNEMFRLFFPKRCCGCGKMLPPDEGALCGHCREQLPRIELESMVEDTAVFSLLQFEPTDNNLTRKILHQIKYYHNVALAREMGRMLGEALVRSEQFAEVDLLVPLPLHPRKARKRGYNQSLELCRGIAKTFPHPICSDSLVRIYDTDSQTHQDSGNREENVRNAFVVKYPKSFYGHHILLVDDTLTTGATLKEAALPLRQLARVKVSFATLSRSLHEEPEPSCDATEDT